MGDDMKVIEGGVTAATGFEATSAMAQIKYKDRTDMALVYSKEPHYQIQLLMGSIQIHTYSFSFKN